MQSSVSFTLGANVENLQLTGTAAINGTGNELANILIGNSAANILDGGAGGDVMQGGLGNDTYLIDDVGELISEAAGGGTDTVRSSLSYVLGSNLENLTLTGTAAINGTGNSLANTLTGNAAANLLDGGAGADTMNGGLGSDFYVVDNIGDVVGELAAGGTDTVESSVTYTLGANVENLVLIGAGAINGTGNGLANSLTGNSAANILNGGIGADTMQGGAGNDTYIADNLLDRAVETAAGDGIDTVQSSATFILVGHVENLILTGGGTTNGIGNALANNLTGNAQANTLDGSAGADNMTGGLGNDTYIVDNAGDLIFEAAGAGTDLVRSALSHTLGANVENLILTGATSINGTGNGLVNSLTGNGGANVLNGGAGADTMNGGAGNDTYVVDNSLDTVAETSAANGTDTVQASVDYTLGANIENLILLGSSAIDGTGNALANSLTGNGASNTLNGFSGADIMRGEGGDDLYIVDNAGDIIGETPGEGTDTVQVSVSYTLAPNVENLILTGRRGDQRHRQRPEQFARRQCRRQCPQGRLRQRRAFRRRRQRHTVRRRRQRFDDRRQRRRPVHLPGQPRHRQCRPYRRLRRRLGQDPARERRILPARRRAAVGRRVRRRHRRRGRQRPHHLRRCHREPVLRQRRQRRRRGLAVRHPRQRPRLAVGERFPGDLTRRPAAANLRLRRCRGHLRRIAGAFVAAASGRIAKPCSRAARSANRPADQPCGRQKTCSRTGSRRQLQWPRKTRELHSHHFDSTVWNDFGSATTTSSSPPTPSPARPGPSRSSASSSSTARKGSTSPRSRPGSTCACRRRR